MEDARRVRWRPRNTRRVGCHKVWHRFKKRGLQRGGLIDGALFQPRLSGRVPLYRARELTVTVPQFLQLCCKEQVSSTQVRNESTCMINSGRVNAPVHVDKPLSMSPNVLSTAFASCAKRWPASFATSTSEMSIAMSVTQR